MNRSARIAGVGLFTGTQGSVTIVPSDQPGIRFQTETGGVCPAGVDHVSDTQRRTSLQSESLHVEMVEHVLAAVWGLGMSDANILVDTEELPMLDGSADPYVRLLEHWPQSDWEWLSLTDRIEWQSDMSRFVIEPDSGFVITYHLMRNGMEICRYRHEWSPRRFIDEISRARTFAWSDEWSDISKLPGVDEHAGFLLGDVTPSGKFAHAGRHETKCGNMFSMEGPRFPEEAARHKILDLIGDWALLERRVACHVHAWGTGHTENMIMIRKVVRALQLDFSRVSF